MVLLLFSFIPIISYFFFFYPLFLEENLEKYSKIKDSIIKNKNKIEKIKQYKKKKNIEAINRILIEFHSEHKITDNDFNFILDALYFADEYQSFKLMDIAGFFMTITTIYDSLSDHGNLQVESIKNKNKSMIKQYYERFKFLLEKGKIEEIEGDYYFISNNDNYLQRLQSIQSYYYLYSKKIFGTSVNYRLKNDEFKVFNLFFDNFGESENQNNKIVHPDKEIHSKVFPYTLPAGLSIKKDKRKKEIIKHLKKKEKFIGLTVLGIKYAYELNEENKEIINDIKIYTDEYMQQINKKYKNGYLDYQINNIQDFEYYFSLEESEKLNGYMLKALLYKFIQTKELSHLIKIYVSLLTYGKESSKSQYDLKTLLDLYVEIFKIIKSEKVNVLSKRFLYSIAIILYEKFKNEKNKENEENEKKDKNDKYIYQSKMVLNDFFHDLKNGDVIGCERQILQLLKLIGKEKMWINYIRNFQIIHELKTKGFFNILNRDLQRSALSMYEKFKIFEESYYLSAIYAIKIYCKKNQNIMIKDNLLKKIFEEIEFQCKDKFLLENQVKKVLEKVFIDHYSDKYNEFVSVRNEEIFNKEKEQLQDENFVSIKYGKNNDEKNFSDNIAKMIKKDLYKIYYYQIETNRYNNSNLCENSENIKPLFFEENSMAKFFNFFLEKFENENKKLRDYEDEFYEKQIIREEVLELYEEEFYDALSSKKSIFMAKESIEKLKTELNRIIKNSSEYLQYYQIQVLKAYGYIIIEKLETIYLILLEMSNLIRDEDIEKNIEEDIKKIYEERLEPFDKNEIFKTDINNWLFKRFKFSGLHTTIFEKYINFIYSTLKIGVSMMAGILLIAVGDEFWRLLDELTIYAYTPLKNEYNIIATSLTFLFTCIVICLMVYYITRKKSLHKIKWKKYKLKLAIFSWSFPLSLGVYFLKFLRIYKLNEIFDRLKYIDKTSIIQFLMFVLLSTALGLALQLFWEDEPVTLFDKES
ncbi:hypothetical protein SAMN02745164_02182 [Marinitoga hydrogenitolerans DSM 16785]|uniref:Uncharacterized protein n=1 Tax=Marinitoga hydrogenitolerans (strain DSM 16785 / JCM 12826 / AT1271) TaxID=1122195 RepID=A0A1M5AGB2_MARH1|nr:hypothetical protein [Marinitoga hydrogenitolerans]SHF29177.1 hypothetical protein SAMN02745164_02182 [Marinitoga hydrogenitolerans DSM 16785]